MGHRDTGVGRHGNRRADPGYDFEGNAGVRQRLGFFPSPAEDERVATFQPDHRLPCLGARDEQVIDLGLGNGVMIGAFADVNQLGAARGEPE